MKICRNHNSCFSRTRFGHHEFWRHQGQTRPDHVVPARPLAAQEWGGQHFYQELGQIHRQQGSVRYLLCLRQHSVLQGNEDTCMSCAALVWTPVFDVCAGFAVLLLQVVCDENGSKGYGFVHFETHEAAERAIEKMNGMLLNDRKV